MGLGTIRRALSEESKFPGRFESCQGDTKGDRRVFYRKASLLRVGILCRRNSSGSRKCSKRIFACCVVSYELFYQARVFLIMQKIKVIKLC